MKKELIRIGIDLVVVETDENGKQKIRKINPNLDKDLFSSKKNDNNIIDDIIIR